MIPLRLPSAPVQFLKSELWALGHYVDTLRAERLAGHDDSDVWQAAQVAERFLITQDLDFSDMRRCWLRIASNIGISRSRHSPQSCERALTDCGRIGMPIQERFWARRFGTLIDQFGVPWSINCE